MDDKEKTVQAPAETGDGMTPETALPEKKKPVFTDRIRKGWDSFVYKTSAGPLIIRTVTAAAVFFSLFFAVRFGLRNEGSLLNDVVRFLGKYLEDTSLVITGIELLTAVLWFVVPEVSVIFASGLLYLSFAEISPIALLFAFALLILFMLEDRPVLALLIALPVVLFLTPYRIGVFLTVLALFASTRGNNGWVKTMGFLYFALLEFCAGCFGTYADSTGTAVLPAVPDGGKVSEKLSASFKLLGAGGTVDRVFFKVLIPLVIFFAVGLIFSRLMNTRYPGNPSDPEYALNAKGKLPIDIKDLIVFVFIAVMLCAVQYICLRFDIVPAFGYGHLSVTAQVLAVYILSRPFAGRSPKRGKLFLTDERKYIFISYSHADIDRVRPYLKYLRENGYEFWYDDSIKAGTEWQGVIASNLTNCSCFLAFISCSSINSEYCLKEINYATAKDKPIAVVMLDDVMLPPVLEMHLASLQAVQRNKFGSTAECMQKVVEMEQLQECRY